MIHVPEGLDDKAVEALEEFFACVRRRFTGRLVFDFRDGQPRAIERNEARRLGQPKKALP